MVHSLPGKHNGTAQDIEQNRADEGTNRLESTEAGISEDRQRNREKGALTTLRVQK